jgi:DnaK suppressor protein
VSNQKEIEKIKALLLARQKELEEAIAQLQAEGENNDQIQDQADQALSSAFETLKSSLHNNEYEEYKMIEKALEMVDAGTYGMCVDCQQDISEKRLQSYPNATRCLPCQETAEEEKEKNSSQSYF